MPLVHVALVRNTRDVMGKFKSNLNQHRIDRQGQILQKKFIDLAGPVSNLLIPFERRIDSLQVGTQHGMGFWRSNTFTRQVEKIANQL